jgi:hypothetical protein
VVEPLRAEPVEHLSNLLRAIAWFASHKEELSQLKNIPQEMQPASLRHPLHAGATKVYRLAGNIRAREKVLVKAIETNLTRAAVRVGTLVNLQPVSFSDSAFLPVLPSARS